MKAPNGVNGRESMGSRAHAASHSSENETLPDRESVVLPTQLENEVIMHPITQMFKFVNHINIV